MHLQPLLYRFIHWETWDWRIKYIPIVPVWVWNCFRARSWWFFTPSNPNLVFGGFEGATKMSIYQHLPPGTYPRSIGIKAGLSFTELEKTVAKSFQYPFVVKPDVGRMGLMFRIIRNAAQLEAYHHAMSVDYLLQELVTFPVEVSIFYYRFPAAENGTITGFVRKEFLEIKGDGVSTMDELMKACPRIHVRLDEMRAKHVDKLQHIFKKDETYILSHALNLSRGCSLVSLEHEIDDRLLKVFNGISAFSETFYYGRYDIKCASVEDLKAGRNFSIIEYNGCGAEPHHVYGNGNSLLKACLILAQHWNILYYISKANASQGAKYESFRQGWKTMRTCRKHFARLKKIDAAFPELSLPKPNQSTLLVPSTSSGTRSDVF